MRRPFACLLVAAAAALGCGGERSSFGLDEPLRVAQAQWKPGELPGTDRQATDHADGGEIDLDGGLFVTGVSTSNLVIEPRQAGKKLKGRASERAYAIAMRLEDMGAGYWVKPVGAEDATMPGELTWEAVLDFGPDLSFGHHALQLVAIDADGHAGPRSELELCVRPNYDDTLNACKPSVPPPGALISLSWDTDADLDLVVVTPSGKSVDARHPSTIELEKGDADPDPEAPGVGLLSADSNPNCGADTIRREDLVWKAAPEAGTYLVYVNLFNACGKPTSHFKVAAYARARGEKSGTYQLVEKQPASYGEVLGSSANGGATPGSFVTTVEFP